MHTAIHSIENSEYAQFGRYLHQRHFFSILLVAFLLHALAIAIYYLMPQQEVEEIPVRILNVRLGGGDQAASAITSADVNRLFSERRLAKQANAANAAAPETPPPAASQPVESEPVSERALETPKPKVNKTTPATTKKEAVKSKRAVAETPKPVITQPKATPKTVAKPKEKAKPKRYVRENQIDSKAQSPLEALGSRLGNRTRSDNDTAIKSRYTQDISLWLDKHKTYPAAARMQGIGGKVILRIRINRQGKVLRYMLEQSSGSDIIDRAITQMVDAANPLPAVPTDYPDNRPYLEFLIPINFIP